MNTVEYKMSKTLANEILKKYGKKGKSNPQTVLTAYVNEQCGLLRPCVRVIVG